MWICRTRLELVGCVNPRCIAIDLAFCWPVMWLYTHTFVLLLVVTSESGRLCRFFKCCFTGRLWNFDCSLHEVDSQLFESMQNSQLCINCLLPDTRNTALYEAKKPPIWTPVLLSLQLVSVFLCQPVPLQFYLIYGFYFILLWTDI